QRSNITQITSTAHIYTNSFARFFFFFFQAEDGIRDGHVTGVQTCALPISSRPGGSSPGGRWRGWRGDGRHGSPRARPRPSGCRRSEERRVGKECRSRWSRCDLKKNRSAVQGGRL